MTRLARRTHFDRRGGTLTRAKAKSDALTYVNDGVREELAILVDRGSKVELDALCNDSRLVDYLQHKLADGDLTKL